MGRAISGSAAVSGVLDTRQVVRRVYLARLSLSCAIYLAALFVWRSADESSTLVASLTFVAALILTAGSIIYSEVYRRPAGRAFLYAQALLDIGVVTAVVHVTGGRESQFAALYILVTAEAALLLAAPDVLVIAAAGIACYTAEVFMTSGGTRDTAFWLQLTVFALVASGCGYVSARLRDASAGREALVAELAEFRLQKGDVDELRQRAQRLEGVAELSASLAHEIKNPLAAIRSAAEQLGNGARSKDDEKALTALVQRESDRLSRLLSEFIDFARLDTAKWTQVDAVVLTSGAISLAENHPDKPQGVKITAVLPPGPVFVDGDPDLLHQALFNLMLNAVQASPPDGRVYVEAAELSARQTPSGGVEFLAGGVAIRISDQGGGISDDIRPRVFDPFVSTKKGGSGLGLAIVQRAVTAHHGHVLLDSSAQGTRFTVLLPKSRL